MSLWVLGIFMNVVYGVDIYCNDKFECTGDSTSNDWVYARGYKSLFQSASSNTSYCYCSGALSCQQTLQFVANQLFCDGSSSCSDTAHLEGATVFGRGSNALTNATAWCSAKYANFYCYGDKSCANSTIYVDSSCALKAYGALSLFGATINVINGTLNAQLFSYYASYQSSIHCQNGTICKIKCYDNACDGLSLICDSTAQCNITRNDVTTAVSGLTPDTSIVLDANDALIFNATTITEINEAKCSAQLATRIFDTFQEHYNKGELIYTTDVGPICCRAQEACASSSITYNSATAATVVCSGSKACDSTQIESNSNDLIVECSAYRACAGASIIGNGGSVYCLSDGSCGQTTITKISNIYCNGYQSCARSIIMSSGTDINVYLNGHISGTRALIICNETDHCTIFCSTYKACGYYQDYDPYSLNMNVSCYGTCSVECNPNSICPDGWTFNPTMDPTSNPTITTTQPTLYPSEVPTTATPTTETLYPTVMPSIFPSKSPTSVTVTPTLFPSVIPTNEPTVETKEPTINPTLEPTCNPSDPPTTANPTTYISTTDIDDYDVKTQDESLQTIAKTFEYANIVIVSLFSFIAITGFIDATFVRINDVFSIYKIIQALLHTLDAMSDIFLCLEVSLIYDNEEQDDSVYLVLLIGMATFILIPLIFSLIQLAMISNKYWINDKNMINSAAIKVWFAKYVYFLYIASVVTGSSFSATCLFNSNLYGLSIFDMGLSDSTFSHFKTKRIYSVILCENIPQLIFQIIYWRVTSTTSIIVVVSMVYSAISILVTLITIYTQRRIIYMQQAVSIQFDVIGDSISNNSTKLRNRLHGIQSELSQLLGVGKAVIEVIRPIIISNGIRIILLIKVDGDINEHLGSFKNTMNDTNDSVLNALKNGWDLDDVKDDDNIQISNVQLSAKESKQTVQETRHIQLSQTTTDQQEIKSLVHEDDQQEIKSLVHE